MSTPSEPVSVTITQEAASSVDIVQTPPPSFSFSLVGPQGPAGPAGPTGDLTPIQSQIDALDARVDNLEIKQLNAQTGQAYTLDLSDRGKFVTMNNASASTLTVPPNSAAAFPVGTFIEGAQLGAGTVTITPGAGVTVNGSPGLKIASQYGTFGLLKLATDTWLAYGRLSA